MFINIYIIKKKIFFRHGINVAGDVAGLRADTNTKLNTWWASAGQIQGSAA